MALIVNSGEYYAVGYYLTDVIINSEGVVGVTSGGVVNLVTVNDAGRLYVNESGRVDSVTLNNGAIIGGANGAAQAFEHVGNNGYIEHIGLFHCFGSITDLDFVGSIYVAEAVMSDCTLNVSDGGAFAIATLYDTQLLGGTVCSGPSGAAFAYLSSGCIASGTLINGGFMDVNSGAVIRDVVINKGRVIVLSSGRASGTVVNPGGVQSVYAGASAVGVQLRGGSQSVSGYAADTVVSSGGVNSVDGSVCRTSVLAGGQEIISAGAGGESAFVDAGGSLAVWGRQNVAEIWGEATVSSYGSLSGAVVHSGGVIYANRGNAFDVDVSGGASVIVSGGSVSGAAVRSGGAIYASGGTASAVDVAAGASVVFSGGTVGGITLSSGASFTFNDAGTISGAVFSSGAKFAIAGGKSADLNFSNTVFFEDVAASGRIVFSKTELKSGVSMTLGVGAIARVCAVSSGATLTVLSGARCSSAAALSGGVMNIMSGANFYGLSLSGGTLNLSSTGVNQLAVSDGIVNNIGGSARYTRVFDGGKVTATNNAVENAASVFGGTLEVLDGSLLAYTSIFGGVATIGSGASATSVTIASGGELRIANCGCATSLYVRSGGTAVVCGEVTGFTISSGGVLYASSATIYGSGNKPVTVSNGGRLVANGVTAMCTVIMSSGGILDLALAGRSAGGAALIDDFGKFNCGADVVITVTVSATQAAGAYKLAGGASAFDKTVTVVTDAGAELGPLSVGGTLTAGDYTYSLAKSESDLVLSVDSAAVGVLKTVAGKFIEAGGVFQYMSDGSGVVRTAAAATTLTGTLDPSKWEFAAVGDFNGDGKDGLVWVEKGTGYAYMQFDMTSFSEVEDKTYCLGVVGEGYSIKAGGDFSASGVDGVLMQGPAFGDPEVSLNYGLPVWARESDGTTFNGWLGALVNTWKTGDPLKGDLTDPASINANNYKYDIVGVGDFDGDGRDDVMLQNTMPKTVSGKTITGSGDVFTFLTGNEAAIKAGAPPTVCYAGCATDGWSVVGFGDFDHDGIDDALLTDGMGVAGWKMAGGQRLDNFWFGNLSTGQTIVGVADVDSDGTDDLIVAADDSITAWLVKNGAVTGSLALK